MRIHAISLVALIIGVVAGCRTPSYEFERPFVQLFARNGVPSGWTVRHWADVANPGPTGAVWKVENAVLHGSEPRGTWLVSDRQYDDFIIEFEFKLPEQGNSGFGFRFPGKGDPAFDGLELQMVDPRYYGNEEAAPDTLTGGLYKAVAPQAQVLRPMDWNKYEIAVQGPFVKVVLNGVHVLDVDLDNQEQRIQRHDGTWAPPLKDRPRRGHIGFQELSRGGGHVQIRNVRIQELGEE